MIDDWNIYNFAKNQVSAVFHSRAIRRNVSPKFIELCMETPCLCPSEGHKHGGRNLTKTYVVKFCYCNEKCFSLELRHIEINASSSTSTVKLAKNRAITHLLTYATAFSGRQFHATQLKILRI